MLILYILFNAIFKGVHIHVSGIYVNARPQINTADIILGFCFFHFFANRGGGDWTTADLKVHCTFFMTASL